MLAKNGQIGPTEERHLRTIFELGAVAALSDGQLLERFGRGDGSGSELAFAALVERHGPLVLRACRAGVGDRHSAEDAFQATFLLLARKARSLWVRDSIAPWLHAVACRVAASCRADAARRSRHERAASRPEAFSAREPDDLARAIHEEIDRLPEPYRAVVILCHLEALTQHEAARRLGCPVGTLQSRLDRGRRRLRDRLGRRGLAPSALAPLPLATLPAGLLASTARAATLIQSGRPAAGLIGPPVFAIINQLGTKGLIMAKWKLGTATILMGATLLASAMGLDPRPRGDGQPSAMPKVVAGTPKPDRPTQAVPPAPAEPARAGATTLPEVIRDSTVRVATEVRQDGEAFESRAGVGTIIKSTAGETLILTSSRIFLRKPTATVIPTGPVRSITVSLIHGNEVQSRVKLPADLVAIEDTLALIVIYPGRELPVAPLAPPGEKLWDGRPMLASAILDDDTKTTPHVSIIDPAFSLSSKQKPQRFPFVRCASSPQPGQPGAGLFDGDKYELTGVFLFGMGIMEMDDSSGVYAGPEAIHHFVDRFLAEPVRPGAASTGRAVPSKTVVRLLTTADPKSDEWKQGVGTIIKSTDDEVLILSSSGIFAELPGARPTKGKASPATAITTVEFPSGADDLKVNPRPTASLVALDLDNSLALLLVRPGRNLPTARLAPRGTKFAVGSRAIETGFLDGRRGTSWEATVLNPAFAMRMPQGNSRLPRVMCDMQPGPEQVGGGLFDGQSRDLMGVFLFGLEVDQDRTSLYAGPEAIQQFLDRNGLASLIPGPPAQADEPPSTSTAVRPSAEDQGEDVPPPPEPEPARRPGRSKPRRPVDGREINQPLEAEASSPPDARISSRKDRPQQPIEEVEAPDTPLEPAPVVPEPEAEPALDEVAKRTVPRPWETVVRVKVHTSDKEWAFGSGTVIKSTPEESIILTAAHLFRLKDVSMPISEHFRVPVTVDLFDGVLSGKAPAMVRSISKDLAAEGIAIDMSRDLALLRIRPGQRLPPTPIVTGDWRPRPGTELISVGCSNGGDATAWSTRILDEAVSLTGPNQKLGVVIKCTNQPKAGRGGGGLYTPDGHLAGVCLFAEPNEHVGLYTRPEAVRGFLRDHGLLTDEPAGPMLTPGRAADSRPTLPPGSIRRVAPGTGRAGGQTQNEPSAAPASPDQERRLTEVERKLDLILESLRKPPSPPR